MDFESPFVPLLYSADLPGQVSSKKKKKKEEKIEPALMYQTKTSTEVEGPE